MTLSASLTVEVAMSSDSFNMMAIGTCLKDLNSSIDIVATKLLTVGVSQGVPLLRPTWLVEASS